MQRVLIGQFGTVARLGLRELLDGQGIEVVAEAESAEEILTGLNEVRPDVVVLDLDDERVIDLAGEITSEFPAIKVIACSCEEPVMRVFPPFHHGESYASKLSADALARALST